MSPALSLNSTELPRTSHFTQREWPGVRDILICDLFVWFVGFLIGFLGFGHRIAGFGAGGLNRQSF